MPPPLRPGGGRAHGRGVASHHRGRRAAGGVSVPHRVPAHRRTVGPGPSLRARAPLEHPLATHRRRDRNGCRRDPAGGGAGGRDRPGARRPVVDGRHPAGRPRRSRNHDPVLRHVRRSAGSVCRRHHDCARRSPTAGHGDPPPDRPPGGLPAAQLLTRDARPSGGDLGHWPGFVAALRKRTEEVVSGSRSGRRGELEAHSWW